MPEKAQATKYAPLSPVIDYVFNRLLTVNNLLLTDLTEAILQLAPGTIQQATVLNPIQPGDTIDAKKTILDIKASLNTGEVIDIEMQVKSTAALFKRILHYTCALYTGQLDAGQDYSKLNKAVGILIADFELFPTGPYHHCFRLQDEASGREYPGNQFEIHTLELHKPQEDGNTRLHNWMQFFCSRSEEEFMSIAQKSPVMERAWESLNNLSQDALERHRALERQRDELAYRTDMNFARQEGLVKGRQEGLVKGRHEGILSVARNLLQSGSPVDFVAANTGLPLTEVQKLTWQR